ncbi:hypothetical protein ABZY30_09425 [Streptomyces massasporeus]|uniref:hypothetical protein n=1 Tax=Streptomyces massasporeus TaxID=67324 RepID=UPI0033B1D368
MALRFGPAGGRNTWSRPADSTSVGASGDEGALSGARDGRVHGYGPEIAPAAGKPRWTVGGALYIPEGARSVYTVDVRDL